MDTVLTNSLTCMSCNSEVKEPYRSICTKWGAYCSDCYMELKLKNIEEIGESCKCGNC